MTPSKNLNVVQNANFRQPVEILDATGQPITDLQGWKFKAEVRSETDAALMLAFVITVGAGVISLRLGPEQTAKLTEDARYDLFARDPGGEVTKVLTGAVKVELSITELPIGG